MEGLRALHCRARLASCVKLLLKVLVNWLRSPVRNPCGPSQSRSQVKDTLMHSCVP